MSDNDEYNVSGFQGLVGGAIGNDLAEASRKHEEERRKLAELRAQQHPNAMNATELLGLKTEQELEDDFGTMLDAEERKAKEAADKYEEENDVKLEGSDQYPPPTITSK